MESGKRSQVLAALRSLATILALTTFSWALFHIVSYGPARDLSLAQIPLPGSLGDRPQPDFVSYIAPKFAGFGDVRNNLAFGNLTSITAIPLVRNPVASFDKLHAGLTIGALYVSTGSERLKLAPGAYLVRLDKDGTGNWIATFLDEKEGVAGSSRAEVRRADAVKVPLAFVDHSVCYRFDETIVCV